MDKAWHPEPDGDPAAGPEPVSGCQAFFEAIDIDVSFGGDRPCHIHPLDRILMPDPSRFESAGAFLATWAYEPGHATKATRRLDRSFGASSFGNESCAREERVAELTAALPGQRLGFRADHFENHAACIGSWLGILRGDNRFLFTAAANA